MVLHPARRHLCAEGGAVGDEQHLRLCLLHEAVWNRRQPVMRRFENIAAEFFAICRGVPLHRLVVNIAGQERPRIPELHHAGGTAVVLPRRQRAAENRQLRVAQRQFVAVANLHIGDVLRPRRFDRLLMVALFVHIRRGVGRQERIHLIQIGVHKIDEAVQVVIVAVRVEQIL